jgi:hypothetical protein
MVLGMLAPFACGALLCSFALLPAPLACLVAFYLFLGMIGLVTFVWQGRQEVRLRFLVVDARTRRPIQGASVFLFRPTLTGPFAEGTTDPQGEASVVVTCRVSAERVLLWANSSIHLDGWFEVKAADYEATRRLYLAWHKFWHLDIGDANLPPTRVELKRLPAAGKE